MIAKYEAASLSSAEGDPKEILALYSKIQAMEAKIAGTGGKAQHLPPSLHSFLSQVFEDLKAGRPVTILKDEVALTTVEAARTLAVSRQFLVQLLEQNEIPFHMVGTHRRVYARDVLAFKGRRDSVRRRPQVGFLWDEGGVFEQAPRSDNFPMSELAWSEIKHEVRDDLLGGELMESRNGLHALDRLEKDFAAIYPEFPTNPAVLLDAGKEEVAKQLARMRANGLLHAAESDVLNHIFRLLEEALLKAA
ncbi:MAG: excisionase family DNA-binding protein [Terracidiphilus sp.]